MKQKKRAPKACGKGPKDLNDPIRDTYLVTDKSPLRLMPLTGYATATISANGALLKIEFRTPKGELRVLPLGMTRSQCTELGQALLRLAVLPYRPDQKAN
jgi:hypothetical protein